jgi:hypothetical protein
LDTDDEWERIVGKEINDMIEQSGRVTPLMVENKRRRNGRLPVEAV